MTRTLVLAMVVVLLCAPGAAGAQSAAPPTIKVGGIADVELFGGAEAGARSRFDAVNAAGGIDGRRIEFLGVTDDRRDTSATTAEVHRLVDAVGVDAVVPIVTSRFADDGTLARARTPAFGWGIAGGFCANPWAFAITGCLAPLLPRQVPTIWGRLVATVARRHGFRHPTAAIVTEAAAVPRSLVELSAMACAAGLRVTYARAALGSGESAAEGVDAIADAVDGGGESSSERGLLGRRVHRRRRPAGRAPGPELPRRHDEPRAVLARARRRSAETRTCSRSSRLRRARPGTPRCGRSSPSSRPSPRTP